MTDYPTEKKGAALADIQTHQQSKRPFGIWLISAFYLFAGTMNLIVLYRVHAQAVLLSPEQLAIVEKAALWGFLPFANLASAVCLFMLKKIAFYIFSSMLIISGINSLALMSTIDLPGQVISGQGITRLLIGYGIGIAVCVYTYRLKQNNTLH